MSNAAANLRKGSTGHRLLDVDQYDEERYVEEADTENLSSALASVQSQVEQMLSSGRGEEALKLVISDPMYKADQASKDESAKLAAKVMGAFKTADISKAVSGMSPAEVNVLLKYVYRGMELPETGASASLLAFHKACVDAAGEGAIVRVLTDRQRV